jgi:hypothetical protein
MRVKYMPAKRSTGPSVGVQFLHPIHKLTLSQGSPDEIDHAGSLF